MALEEQQHANGRAIASPPRSSTLTQEPEGAGGGAPTTRWTPPEWLLRLGQATRKRALFVFLVAALGYLILPGLVMTVWISFSKQRGAGAHPATSTNDLSVTGYHDALFGPGGADTIKNTAIFAVGVLIGALIIGTFMAWIVARTNVPGRRLAYLTPFAALGVPGLPWVVAWMLLLGGGSGLLNEFGTSLFGHILLNVYSMPGLILVESLRWAPVVFLLVVGPLKSFDPSLEQAAITSGASKLRVLRRVTLPLMWPSLAAAGLLACVGALQAFEVPLFLGTPGGIGTISSQIYRGLQSSFIPNYSLAAAYGTLLLVVLSIVLAGYYWSTRLASRFRTTSGTGYQAVAARRSKFTPLGSLAMAVLVILYLLPIAMMVVGAFADHLDVTKGQVTADFGWKNLKGVIHYPGAVDSMIHTLIVATVTAILVLVLAVLGAWIITRSKLSGTWIVDQLFSLPLVIPGVVMSLGVMLFYLYVPIPLYGTLGILIVALAASMAVFALRYLHPAFLQLDEDFESAAMCNGASWFRTIRKIILPLVRPAIIGGFLVVFFFSVQNLPAVSLIYSGSTQVVSTEMLDMTVNGQLNQATAFGLIVTVAEVIVVGAALLLLSHRRPTRKAD